MIKLILVTGFLGSGKTTFIKKYARYLAGKGFHPGVVVNDYGAINIDRMLLNPLGDYNIPVEMIINGTETDYKRRLKTKLITFKMMGVSHVLIEPSGIYNMDVFFDLINDDDIYEYVELSSVFTTLDYNQMPSLSKESLYVLMSEISYSGKIILLKDNYDVNEVKTSLNNLLKSFSSTRIISDGDLIHISDESSLNGLENVSYFKGEYNHLYFPLYEHFRSVFVYNLTMNKDDIREKINTIFSDNEYGLLQRVKGYICDKDKIYELNFTKDNQSEEEVTSGQNVIIFIGENLNEKKIRELF